MPIVAITKVIAPMTVTHTLSILETISTGSVIASPKTAMLPAVTATVTIANGMKLTGRPQKLPRTTVARFGANREKSQKFSSSVEKKGMVSAVEKQNAYYAAEPVLSA